MSTENQKFEFHIPSKDIWTLDEFSKIISQIYYYDIDEVKVIILRAILAKKLKPLETTIEQEKRGGGVGKGAGPISYHDKKIYHLAPKRAIKWARSIELWTSNNLTNAIETYIGLNKSKKYKELLFPIAKEYWKKNPKMTREQVATYLKNVAAPNMGISYLPSIATLSNFLRGMSPNPKGGRKKRTT